MKTQSFYITIAITGSILLLGTIAILVYVFLNTETSINPGGFIGAAAILWTSAKTKLLNFGKFPKIMSSIGGQTSTVSVETPQKSELEQKQEIVISHQAQELVKLQKKADVKKQARHHLRKIDGLYECSLIKEDSVRKAMELKKYKVFEDATASNGLNIIGVRHHHASSNSFDDAMVLMWKDLESQEWNFHRYKITTDPGLKRLINKSTTKGAAILQEGQYQNAYSVGTHRKGKSNSHEALVQVGEVTVHRDTDKDEFLDYDSETQTGKFGINIHRASLNIDDNFEIGGWSAGCQVFARKKEFNEFLSICRKAQKEHKQKFTYTLLNIEDIVEAVGEMA